MGERLAYFAYDDVLGNLDLVVYSGLCCNKWKQWNRAIGIMSGNGRKPRVAQKESSGDRGNWRGTRSGCM